MRNSSSFWEKTPRPGDLVWCKQKNSARYKLGIVVDIHGYDYWNSEETFSKWIYKVWVDGALSQFQSWKVEKV